MTISNEIEKYILGCFIKKPSMMGEHRHKIWIEAFYSKQYQMIARALFTKFDSREEINPILLADLILSQNPSLDDDRWEKVSNELEFLLLRVPFPCENTLAGYIENFIIRGCASDGEAKGKKISLLAQKLLSPDEFIAEAQKIIQSMKAFTVNTDDGKTDSIKNLANAVLQKAEKVRLHDGEAPGFFSGYSGLHKRIGPFQEGDVFLLSAVPGIGKTTFGLNLMLSVAQRGTPCLMFSIEMQSRNVATKILSNMAMVDSKLIPAGKYDETQAHNLGMKCSNLIQYPITINESARINTAKIERDIIKYKPKFVLIDYLQKITKELKKPVEAIEKLTQELVEIAKINDVFMLVISSLNGKQIKGRDNKRPGPFDLHGAGCLAYDADIIAFLHSEQYWIGEDAGYLEFIVSKHRMGENLMTMYTDYSKPNNWFSDFRG